MSPKRTKSAKSQASQTQRGPGKPPKKWCSGKIYFTDRGCLYVKDPDLANELYQRFLRTGKLCITIDDPNQPKNEINLLCLC